MNTEKILNTILAPRMSEKTTYGSSQYRQYVFKVATDSTKPEIKQAVEELFKVKVHSVRVVNVKPKTKTFRQTVGKRKGWKKAYVALQPGQELNEYSGAK